METKKSKNIRLHYIQFKSYYVVWKPFLNIPDIAPINRFKSYYVVWKPFSFFVLLFFLKSLNRTMQYGNGIWKYPVQIRACEFKSYYVVWKPSLLVLFHSFRLCLNRTMQYGNILLQKAALTCCPEFKSYYVVWKLMCFDCGSMPLDIV